MSAYVELASPMTDPECVVKALADMGYPAKKVEVHDTPVPLVGFDRSAAGSVANIVIRRKYVGRLSNDIGFLRTATGYRIFISDYDQHRFGPAWQAQLQLRYIAHSLAKDKELEQRAAAGGRAGGKAGGQAGAREEDRRRMVETRRQEVREKARRLGYHVEETRQGDGVRLVLTKSGF
ncbi:MAG TPA: hypothetical protein VFU73_14770 [Actinocrinis sp.]|nr:hypothetical protein [Actinocrinis sp.]